MASNRDGFGITDSRSKGAFAGNVRAWRPQEDRARIAAEQEGEEGKADVQLAAWTSVV